MPSPPPPSADPRSKLEPAPPLSHSLPPRDTRGSSPFHCIAGYVFFLLPVMEISPVLIFTRVPPTESDTRSSQDVFPFFRRKHPPSHEVLLPRYQPPQPLFQRTLSQERRVSPLPPPPRDSSTPVLRPLPLLHRETRELAFFPEALLFFLPLFVWRFFPCEAVPLPAFFSLEPCPPFSDGSILLRAGSSGTAPFFFFFFLIRNSGAYFSSPSNFLEYRPSSFFQQKG